MLYRVEAVVQWTSADQRNRTFALSNLAIGQRP
jgi:hypothetical protein